MALERIAVSQREMIDRIHWLFQLSLLYVEQFGIPFEKRHAYRNQLFALLAGEHENVDAAKQSARDEYDEQNGTGIPRTMNLVLRGSHAE